MFLKVAGIILAKNEEERVSECLEHLRPYIDYILVIVDSETTDKTVEIAKKYADRVVIRPFSGSFAEEKNYARTLIPKDCSWVLYIDVDERFDLGLLREIKNHLQSAEDSFSICFRFPRLNLPDGNSFPDYQVRLIKNSRDIEWRGKVHEVPYLKTENLPLDQLDSESRERKLFVVTADWCPIIHLPRKGEKRSWW